MGYCTIADIRAEGFNDPPFDDARVQAQIDLATNIIDRITQRFFEPRDMIIKVDGRKSPDLLLNHPIIAINEVRLLAQDIASQDVILDTDEYEVYNRHLSQELLDPDDRENPKISLIRFTDDATGTIRTTFRAGVVFGAEFWPFGVQNIQIDGRFGYTDPDGTSDGETPLLITRACMLIAASKLRTFSQEFSNPTGPVVMERVRDQTIKYSSGQQQGSFQGGLTGMSSGSLEADQILAMYSRPVDLGAA